jgi:hypothetical protein
LEIIDGEPGLEVCLGGGGIADICNKIFVLPVIESDFESGLGDGETLIEAGKIGSDSYLAGSHDWRNVTRRLDYCGF